MWQAFHEAFTLHTTVCESSGFWWLPFTATMSICSATYKYMYCTYIHGLRTSCCGWWGAVSWAPQ